MSVRYAGNPYRIENSVFGDAQRACFDPEQAAQARAILKAWPCYRPTPLHDCPALADRLGIGRLLIKDEGQRRPLRSFKSLGGAFALGELLRERLADRIGRVPTYSELFSGCLEHETEGFCAVSATDGNHGRSLAWGARLFGVRCRVFLPVNVSQARTDAIAAFGAEIVRIDGNYDAAVAAAAAESESNGSALIQDTSFDGYTATHRLIMHGYSLMAEEIVEQLGGERPTHSFLQVGCGGMAATITAHLWHSWGADLPRVVLVQSLAADALVQSFETRMHQAVGGDHETLMIGIACGEIANLAWPLFEPTALGALAIDDRSAVEAMRMTIEPSNCSPPILMGETGAAGLAALLVARRNPAIWEATGLGADSMVLLINSEGETDPESYEALTGMSAAAVRSLAGEARAEA